MILGPPTAHRTAFTTLGNSSSRPSPLVLTMRWLGEVDWDGKRVMAIQQDKPGNYSHVDAERRPLATIRDGKPLLTFHPYETSYDWPLFVGKSWRSENRVTFHDRNQTLE